MAEYMDEDEMLIETEPEDSYFVKEEGEAATDLVIDIQPKEPRYHAKTSDFLLKVFGKEYGVQSHQLQRQL